MKILLINNLYGRYARGGAERIVATIAEELERAGNSVAILTAGVFTGLRSLWPRAEVERTGSASTSSANNGMSPERSRRVYRFFPNSLFSIINIGRYPRWMRLIWHIADAGNDWPAWMLLRVVLKEKPEIVWTHNLKGLGGYIPTALRLLKIAHIHQLHDVQLLDPSGLLYLNDLERKWPWHRRLYANWYRRRMGSPTLVVSPTQWLLDLHLQHGFFKKSKTLVLANPTPSCPVLVPHSDGVIPSRVEGSRINLLFAGQLVEHKGIRFLIEALKAADFSFSWELHIAGTGALESKLQGDLAGDARFIFHGKLSAQPFEQVWSQIDLTIVPSLCIENAPTIILESFARGIPVLASRVGGIPEMVKEGESGWLFEPGNPGELREKLAFAVQKIQDGFRPEHQTPQSPKDYAEQVLTVLGNFVRPRN